MYFKMNKKMLVSVLIGLCILNKFSSSMNILTTQEIESLNVTDVPLANISKGLSTNFSSEISDSLPTKDEAIQSSNVTTVESAKKSKDSNRFALKDRSRRQQFLYPQTRYIPPNYVAPGLFDLCPPLGTNCPVCFKESTKLSNTFCSGSYIALKVIVLSPPQSDTSGRVCGKLGLLKVLGVGLESSLNDQDFRKLLRFSIDESCGCTLAVSKIYYVIAHLSIFLKEGLLINKIILTDQAILLSNDLYVEREIIHHFSRCHHPESAYIPSSIDDPYQVPSVPPILPPRVEPVQVTDDPLVPLEPILPHVADPYKVSPMSPEPSAVDPYQIAAVSPEPQALQPIPPDVPVMPPIAEPVLLQPYVSPPAEVQVPPALPILPIEDAQSHPAPPPEPIMPRSYLNPYATDVSHIRKSIFPSIYPLTGTNYLNKLLHGPVLTTCLLPETCPKCYRIEDVMDIAPPYCGSNFAFIAVIRIPDSSSIQAESTSYAAQNCMSLFTNIVYDVTMNKDAKVMVNTLKALLPVQCFTECFKGVKGRVIAMILGPVPIVAPASQLDANIMLFILPAPSTIVLPTCSQYYPGYLSTYSLRLEGPQQYSSSSCPDALECPVCQPEPDDTIFSYACEYGFVSIVEMDFSEPTLISQQLPSISVKKIATYYQVIDEIVISHPPSNQCVKATFKVVQNLGHFPLNFPGYKILFLSPPNCGCLTQGYQRLLVFSSKAAELSQAGTLHLTKDIYISPLSAQNPTPTCQQPHNPIPFVQPTSPPPPPAYPTYVPQSHPYPYYERPPRVALTYIPPSPPPPSYIPLSSPPPLHYISYPGYMPGSVHESAYPPAPSPPILSSQNETAYVPPQSAIELSTSDPNLVLPAISSLPDYQPPVDPAYPPSSINHPGPNVAKEGTATHASIPVSTSPIAVHSLSTPAHEQLPSTYDIGAPNVIGYNGTFAGPCLSSEILSCPITAQKITKEFHDFYCKSQFALIVAVGIDFKIPWQDKKDSEELYFIEPDKNFVGINYEESLRLFNLSVTVTRKKAMERRHRNIDIKSCFREKVLTLYDVSPASVPRAHMDELDLYIPAICDIEAFDLNPGYGILLSQQPIPSSNAIQLAHKYSYFPLTEALLPLPYCDQRKKATAFHSSTRLKAVKQRNKANPLNYVSCPLKITCSKWTAIENIHYHVPCKAENVVLIEVLETSAGPIVAPDLEIMEYLNDKNQPYIVLNVETTTDELYGIFDRVDYIDGTKGCKYAKVKVLKDLSPESMTMEGNLFTIIASADCNNGLFKMVNGIALLMSDKPILPDTAVYLEEDSTEVVGIHPGTTHISLCSSHSAVFMPKEVVTSPDHVSSKNYDPLPDKSAIVDEYPPSDIKPRMTEEKPADPIKKKPVQSETSCQGHIDDSCPVCEDIYSISPEIYCNSQLSLLTRAIGLHYDNQTCSYGTLASLYDATASKAPELSVLKISYTIPAHCSCSALKENSYLLIMMEESMPMTNPLPLKFSKGMHLYTATEGRTSLPTCVFQDALIARSGNISKIIELDSPNKELREMMPELSLLECPNMDRTCPKCGSVSEEELKSLYCESEEVLLVSRNKKSKNDTRKFPSTGKITFVQFMNDENYTLDINIDQLESICTLPLEEGNCSESNLHYYYDTDLEMCTEFFYSGCGGNANNFAEMDQCHDACYRPDFCVEGSLNVKKIIRSPDNDDYPNAKFLYSLPEHCECPDLFEGDGTAYLMSTSDVDRSNTQLTDSHYFIPLPKDQKKKKISCE